MSAPSNWVKRHIAEVTPGGRIVDVAAGRGRHTLLALTLGYSVVAVDRNGEALDHLRTSAGAAGLETETLDLEGENWPLEGRKFDGVIVCNYLYRPFLPRVLELVDVGGVLIYETFALGNEAFGRPSNPDFLLRPNELLTATLPDFEVLAYGDVTIPEPVAARKQRIAARRRG